MKEITKKILEEKINEGWTTKQFADYYEMTEKEFLLSLNKLSSVKNYIDGIKRRLSKNDKKFKQLSSKETVKPVTEEKIEVKESIDDLLKLKEELLASTKKAEDFISNTPSYIAHIEEQIEREKARHELYMAGFQQKIEAAIARRDRICEIINTNSKQLKVIEEKINLLSNIKVIVTKDGNIVIDNDTISIPKKWQDICFDIMRDERFKELEIKDMKVLAKLLTLINSEDLSKKFEISFESEKFKKYFELLKDSSKN